jgi:hypothetical protein
LAESEIALDAPTPVAIADLLETVSLRVLLHHLAGEGREICIFLADEFNHYREKMI